MVIVVCGVLGLLLGVWRATRSKRVALVFASAIVVAVALGSVAIANSGTSAVGPIARIVRGFTPQWSATWVRQTATSLWVRDGYGTIAVEMIRRFPFVGVGLSGFYGLVPVFSWILFQKRMPMENAQNWYRHELAELGTVGSLGWIVWTVVLLFLILTARSRPGRQLSSTVLRFVLVGFGVVSLVGMPGQSLVVAFTFWTLAFGFFVKRPAVPRQSGANSNLRRWRGSFSGS